MPRISVLINNYNNGPWLRECVDSVLAQTRSADEVIVYDDGSTDESIGLLRAYGDRITLIEGKHIGTRPGIHSQGHGIAVAFAASSGEHIHLLDGDDFYFKERIARYEEAWDARPEAVLVQCPMVLIDEAGIRIRDNYERSKQRQNYRRATYLLNDVHFYYPTSALAFRRDYLARLLPLDFSVEPELAADARLSVVAPLFGPVLALTETLCVWRRRPGSDSQIGNKSDPLASTLRRHGYFNHFARRNGFRPLVLWLNMRYLRQRARRFFPAWLSAPFVHNPEGRR
ncbi:MAG: hypothetical protein RIQ79_1946 [Verrucomicrobiota bacterium]